MAKDPDELWNKFEASYRKSRARAWRNICRRCGYDGENDGYGCYYCDSKRKLPESLSDIVWREAVAIRKAGRWTARQFFNKLTINAKVALMREVIARQQVAKDGLGHATKTLRWLLDGLRPGSL